MCLWLAELLIFYSPKVAGNLSEIPIHSKLSGPRLWLLRAGDVTWTAESGSFLSQTTGYITKDDLELLILQPPSLPSVGSYRYNTFMSDFSKCFWESLFWNHFLWNSSRKETCDRRDLEFNFKLFETTELLAMETGVWPGVPRTQSLAWAPCGPPVFTNRFETCFHVK